MNKNNSEICKNQKCQFQGKIQTQTINKLWKIIYKLQDENKTLKQELQIVKNNLKLTEKELVEIKTDFEKQQTNFISDSKLF
jgi:chromosome segregation ATPase